MAVRHADVCGTIVEIQGAIKYGHPASEIDTHLDAIRTMLQKVQVRDKEYLAFASEMQALLERMEKRKKNHIATSIQAARKLNSKTPELLTRLIEVRKTARLAELTLRSCKDLALSLYESFTTLKGHREWMLNGRDDLEKRWQAWLPPEPAKTKLLQMLRAHEAFVMHRRGSVPVVHFEDGGEMPMASIRAIGAGPKARLYVEE